MAAVLRYVSDFLVGPNYFDERVQSWPLMDWKAAVAISVLYVMGVDIGKRLMANRKPYNMKQVSALHNTFMFSLSLYMVIETLTQAWINFGWAQNLRPWGNVAEPGTKFSPSGYRLARVIWIHYISKAYEFMDTLIMVLRKNERQITFLHVYHHASTFFPCWWSAVNFAPGGDVYFICALNSFVHVLMYGYYLATCLGWKAPQVIKKSITTVQMVQFALLNIQAFYGVFWASWYRPRIVVVLAIIQSVVFMCLFYNFMRKAYSGSKGRAHPKVLVEDAGMGIKDE